MKGFKKTFLEIYHEDRSIFLFIFGNFLAGLALFVFSLFNLSPDSAVVLLGVIILLLIPFIYFGIRMAGYPKLAIGVGVILLFLLFLFALFLSFFFVG